MKLNSIILYLTTFLAIYLWVYDNLLYEKLYLSYLPNYTAEVAFPIYAESEATPSQNQEQNSIPLWSLLLYRISQLSIIITPILFCVLLISSMVILIKKWKSSIFKKWAVIQFSLMIVIFFVFTAVDIMD